MLNERQDTVLRIIVGEYVSHATPVPSQTLARQKGLRLSPASIRSVMAELAEAGYIRRPHISSGGVPSDKGYRYHVEALPAEAKLREDESVWVRQRIGEATEAVDTGTRLAADLLASLVGNAAVVSTPRTQRARLKRVELVLLQETLALLVLIFQEAKTGQRILRLPDGATQETLTTVANKLSAAYGGSTLQGMAVAVEGATALECQVLEAAREAFVAEDVGRLEDPEVTGVRRLLGQPEFAQGTGLRAVLEVLEDRHNLNGLLSGIIGPLQERVVIGAEHESDDMQQCSVVVARYGQQDGVNGYLAVVGPTRMDYLRAIASVRLLAGAMTDLVTDLR